MKRSRTRSLLVYVTCFSLVLLLSFGASIAFAQMVVGPGATPTPTPTTPLTVPVSPIIKTPPLQDGQLVTIPIAVHNPGPAALPNWAGVLVQVHRGDPSEVEIAGVKVGGVPVPNPFPPTSTGLGSTVATFTVFHPAAFLSGTSLGPSSVFPAITLDLIAKNTTPANNSDIDINLAFADIFHQPDRTFTSVFTTTTSVPYHIGNGGSTPWAITIPGSTAWQWEDSHRVLVSSGIESMANLHIDQNGEYHNQFSQNIRPFPGAPLGGAIFESNFAIPRGNPGPDGHFHHFPAGQVHVVTSVVTGHVAGGFPQSTIIPAFSPFTLTVTAFLPGSTIYAFPFLATASIGIEHIPEPTAPLLLLGGMASLACGFRARRRRRLT